MKKKILFGAIFLAMLMMFTPVITGVARQSTDQQSTVLPIVLCDYIQDLIDLYESVGSPWADNISYMLQIIYDMICLPDFNSQSPTELSIALNEISVTTVETQELLDTLSVQYQRDPVKLNLIQQMDNAVGQIEDALAEISIYGVSEEASASGCSLCASSR